MKNKLITYVEYLLFFIFMYSGLEKFIKFEKFYSELQVVGLFPSDLIGVISIVLPIFEILGAILICTKKLKNYGFMLSVFLLVSFSVYLVLINTLLIKPPCSCGNLFRYMSFEAHLLFNITLAILSGMALFNNKPQVNAEKQIVEDV